jgi:hypothetical protein
MVRAWRKAARVAGLEPSRAPPPSDFPTDEGLFSGGEECLYNTRTAHELQAAKRQWVREFQAAGEDLDQRAQVLHAVHSDARERSATEDRQ